MANFKYKLFIMTLSASAVVTFADMPSAQTQAKPIVKPQTQLKAKPAVQLAKPIKPATPAEQPDRFGEFHFYEKRVGLVLAEIMRKNKQSFTFEIGTNEKADLANTFYYGNYLITFNTEKDTTVEQGLRLLDAALGLAVRKNSPIIADRATIEAPLARVKAECSETKSTYIILERPDVKNYCVKAPNGTPVDVSTLPSDKSMTPLKLYVFSSPRFFQKPVPNSEDSTPCAQMKEMTAEIVRDWKDNLSDKVSAKVFCNSDTGQIQVLTNRPGLITQLTSVANTMTMPTEARPLVYFKIDYREIQLNKSEMTGWNILAATKKYGLNALTSMTTIVDDQMSSIHPYAVMSRGRYSAILADENNNSNAGKRIALFTSGYLEDKVVTKKAGTIPVESKTFVPPGIGNSYGATYSTMVDKENGIGIELMGREVLVGGKRKYDVYMNLKNETPDRVPSGGVNINRKEDVQMVRLNDGETAMIVAAYEKKVNSEVRRGFKFLARESSLSSSSMAVVMFLTVSKDQPVPTSFAQLPIEKYTEQNIIDFESSLFGNIEPANKEKDFEKQKPACLGAACRPTSNDNLNNVGGG